MCVQIGLSKLQISVNLDQTTPRAEVEESGLDWGGMGILLYLAHLSTKWVVNFCDWSLSCVICNLFLQTPSP